MTLSILRRKCELNALIFLNQVISKLSQISDPLIFLMNAPIHSFLMLPFGYSYYNAPDSPLISTYYNAPVLPHLIAL